MLKKLILTNDKNLISSIFQNCDAYCKAKVIDASLEYIDYKEKLVGSNDPLEYGNLRKSLLLARAQDGIRAEPIINVPTSTPPDLGHDSALVSLSIGSTFSGDLFSDIRWRPALHDIEANSYGYSDALGIGFLDTIVRADYKNKQVYLKNFHLLEITSLPAQVPNIHFLAWHFDSGYEYGFGFGDASTQGRSYLQLGIGSAVTGFENKTVLYSIIHGDFGYSYEFGAHIGPTLSMGAMLNLSSNFKIIAKSDIAKRFNNERSIDSIKYSVTLAAYAVKNLELLLNVVNNNNLGELSLAVKYYF